MGSDDVQQPDIVVDPMTLHKGEVAVDSDLVRTLLYHQRPDLADLAITQIGGGTYNRCIGSARITLRVFPARVTRSDRSRRN